MFAAKNELFTRPSGGYQISRSLRFNSADSTYLSRTPASATNRRTYTFSTWVKRSQLNSGNAMLATVNGSAFNYFSFGTSTGDFLTFAYFDGSSDVFGVNTSSTSVFRDVSAWYHIVLYVDTTQATASNRVKFYVNNVEQTGLGGTYPTLNYDTQINSIISTIIGGGTGSNTAYLSDQYMTEINFIDGQALTPSSFGETNAQTGVWQPKAYSGSYGTNGFYLNFSDNSNNTSTTLGKDYSGNGNNWTPNGFIVTAGVDNDSLVDTPTPYGVDTGVGGNVGGNYSTMNPLAKGSSQTITNGNLQTSASSSWGIAPATFGMSSGKWYCEVTQTAGGSYNRVGLTTQSAERNNYIGIDAYGWAYLNDTGNKGTNGATTAYGASWTTNDTVGIAFDADTGSLTFYKNGTSQGVAYTGLTSGPYFFTFASYDVTLQVNFGQRPFAYTAPSGFKALCTQNLPTPTIGATTATQANQFFTPTLYTGDGTNNRFISAGMTPDWTWIKERGRAGSNFEFDTLRGTGIYLITNSTGGDNSAGSLGWTNSGPTSGGFKVDVGTNDGINYNTGTFVAWNWKANGAGVTNTAGSITSTVSANTTSGFSIVTYTGTSANATVGHGLGAAPKMYIIKCRSNADFWPVWHTSIYALNPDNYLGLSNAGAVNAYGGVFTNVAPTSTTFAVGTDTSTNTSTRTYVAYCFAEVAGYSKFGSYTGNGSTDGPFVFTGMRPAYVMVRRTDTNDQWTVYDSARNSSNLTNRILYPNLANTEDVGTDGIDMLSNGFKVRATYSNLNASGGTYIYACFASAPLKYSLAR